MHNFQSFLKSVRESKELEQKTIADAINLSEETIILIEEADNEKLLQSSSSLLKNQIRRYCEHLEIPEKKIVSILNKIDILYYKKSYYGKLKIFDYINRFVILIITVAIIVLVTKHVRQNIDSTDFSTPENSKSTIIYTPIDYNVDSSSDQNDDTSNSQDNTKQKTSNNTSMAHKKSTVAHPPATANMNDIVIDDDSDAK